MLDQARESLQSFKVVLVGPHLAGKTCLLSAFCESQFPENVQPTLGANFVSHRMDRDGEEYYLEFWDTAGQEAYADLSSLYFRNAICCLAVCDISTRDAMQDLVRHIDRYKTHCEVPRPRVVVAGNKADLLEDAHRDEAVRALEDFGTEQNCSCFLTSAKTGENVNRIFESVLSELLKERDSVLTGNVANVREGDTEWKCC
jgi:Ras-related protein Rab-5C